MFNDLMEMRVENPLDHPDVFFISILDPDCPESFHKDADNFKTWWFYDLEYEVGSYKPMSEEQAKEIVEFISKNKDKKRCIVHCSAGVSRSGAIGEFINDLYGEKYQDFKRTNPNIIPNIYIKKLLNNQL